MPAPLSGTIPTPPAMRESGAAAINGWSVLLLNLALFVAAGLLLAGGDAGGGLRKGLGIAAMAVGVALLFGYFTVQPNEARVLILFGAYEGTIRTTGFHWANPLYARNRGRIASRAEASAEVGRRGIRPISSTGYQSLSSKLSLRVQNFNTPILKVNDKRGNPVEIAAVVVWRVSDTAQAAFDVEDYSNYVEIQSEAAVRTIASRYAYDRGEEQEITLREGAEEVAHALQQELQARLLKAGVVVEEARLTHLAYAAEIAPTMLRRQQAEAIVAARQIIVRNAVSMVQLALRSLDEQHLVSLDEERRAAMISNLLVVLCGNTEASPVINTGTLYT